MKTRLTGPKPIRVGQMQGANVTQDNLCCTLNTRYEDMAFNDMLDLGHFPKTVVLVRYEQEPAEQ